MSKDLKSLVKRRIKAYENSIAKTELVHRRIKLYKCANDGFVSTELTDAEDKAQATQAEAFKQLSET